MVRTVKCIVCGQDHEYCSSCSKYKDFPSWYNLYCSEGCREYAKVLVAYYQNKMSKKQAKRKLKGLDPSQLAPKYREIYDEIVNNH